ncbi:MAG: lysine 2,3-aminomutase, partial [Methylocella sp.]
MRKPPGTLRSAADLIGAGLVPEAKKDAIERVAEIYAIGITGTVAGLIDSTDPTDPIARQFVPDLAELS